MSDFEYGAFLVACFLLGWFSASKKEKKHDVGILVLASMVKKLRDSSKFVGPKAEMTVSQQMELEGDVFTLSMSLTNKERPN